MINIRLSRSGGKKKSGGDGAVVTPVSIPNTEVKHRSGDCSWGTGKSSALPGFFFYVWIEDPENPANPSI